MFITFKDKDGELREIKESEEDEENNELILDEGSKYSDEIEVYQMSITELDESHKVADNSNHSSPKFSKIQMNVSNYSQH